MLRRFLEAVGDLFKRINVDVVMGLIVASLVTLQRVQILGVNTQSQIVGVVVTFTLIVILISILFQGIGVLFTWMSEIIPANIRIEPIQHLPLPYRLENGDSAVDHFANLIITNNEHLPITDCYAILKKTNYLFNPFPYMSFYPGTKYLKWKGSKDYKIELSAHGGQAILHIYQITTKLAEVGQGENSEIFHFFSIWGMDKAMSLMQDRFIIDVIIEIHGTLNGKSVKSRDFVGLVIRDGNPDFSKKLFIRKGKLQMKKPR